MYVTMTLKGYTGVDLSDLVKRSASLSQTIIPEISPVKKPVRFCDIDHRALFECLGDTIPVFDGHDMDVAASYISDSLYVASRNCQSDQPELVLDDDIKRWSRFIANNDSKTLWKAIGWNGKLNQQVTDQPSVDEFQQHFESLLNPDQNALDDFSADGCPEIPILDSPISPMEYDEVARKCKPNKAAGCDGVPPGIFRILPANWIMFIVSFFNEVFFGGQLPAQWCYSRLITVLKKGPPSMCRNYRGISITDGIVKIYDSILNKRFSLWYRPRPEQTGAQAGKGCIEQILSLRLLIAYAKSRRLKLWILFVDFTQAYDRVPRDKLLQELKRAGCGKRFVLAIRAMYVCTKYILKSAIISASAGVKQGAPISCLLFVFYLDIMIRKILLFGPDGFLNNLHTLLMMDDTALVATTRERCVNKFRMLLSFCDEYGMIVNQSKTKFMVVNGAEPDKSEISIGEDIRVEYCDTYWYLGSPICDDGKMSTIATVHSKDKIKHVFKFFTFLKKNYNMPFMLKRKVAEACVLSALLYGTETWLTDNFKQLEILYGRIIRALLGVKSSTPIDLCLIEAGMSPLKNIIMDRRRTFMSDKIPNLTLEDPLGYCLNLTRDIRDYQMRAFRSYLGYLPIDTRERISTIGDDKTRYHTYRRLNPSLVQHPVYMCNLRDSLRINVTRFMLSSHRLRVETGRWTRPPTPHDRRLCTCGNTVQDEEHVLMNCPLTEHIRAKYAIDNSQSLLGILTMEPYTVANIITETLSSVTS